MEDTTDLDWLRAELDKTSFVFVTCARLKEEDPLSSLTEKGNDRSAVVQALRDEAERVTRAVASAKEEGTSLPYQDKYPGCRAFLDLKKKTQEQLVDRIVVVPESFNAGQLREELAKRLNKVTPVDVREALYSRVEAWWDGQVALSLLGQRTRHITKRELLSQINHLTIELGEASLPDDYSERTPDKEDLAEELGGIMEKQIRLVRGGEGRVMRAAKARWRARNQRERWMQERLANASLLDQFDARLVDEWEGLYGPMCDDTGDQDEERCCQAGVGLLDWSHKEAPNSVAPVKPDWQHPYLVRGSYQQLAEEMRVGWLPGYERHPALQEDE